MAPRTTGIFLMICLLLSLSTFSLHAGPAHETFRDEIDQMLQTQAAAWNRGDLVAFCSVYSENATFISPSGLTHGRQAILDRYRARYKDTNSMGTLSLEILEINLASGPSQIHGAAAVARWKIAYADKEDLAGLTLLVLRPEGDRWVFVQDASM